MRFHSRPPLDAALRRAREAQALREEPPELLDAPLVELVAEAGAQQEAARGSASAPRAPGVARARRRRARTARPTARRMPASGQASLPASSAVLERAHQRCDRAGRAAKRASSSAIRRDDALLGEDHLLRDAASAASPATRRRVRPARPPLRAAVDLALASAQVELQPPAMVGWSRAAPQLERADLGEAARDVHRQIGAPRAFLPKRSTVRIGGSSVSVARRRRPARRPRRRGACSRRRAGSSPARWPAPRTRAA